MVLHIDLEKVLSQHALVDSVQQSFVKVRLSLGRLKQMPDKLGSDVEAVNQEKDQVHLKVDEAERLEKDIEPYLFNKG